MKPLLRMVLGQLLVTISDSNFMGTDITPLPLAYGWVSEEYILTNYNFSDAIIHKTLVRSDENLDMEKAWEEKNVTALHQGCIKWPKIFRRI